MKTPPIILVPGFKIAPAIFRWRVVSRIYRWYSVLQRIERDADVETLDAERVDALLARLENVESTVTRLAVPPAFGDLLYGLRSHIAVVRASLQARRAAL